MKGEFLESISIYFGILSAKKYNFIVLSSMKRETINFNDK